MKKYGDFSVLKEFAIEMCKKYKQDSVYIQAPDESPIYIDMFGNQVSAKSSLNFKYNDSEQEFFTTVSRKKKDAQRFTADIQFENLNNLYCEKNIGSLNERMRRSKSGEVLL